MEHLGVNDKGFARCAPAHLRSLSTVALFGATAIVAQVLLLRECLVVVAGNELFIALFFGCWFIGIAAGAAVGAIWKVGDNRLTWLVPAFLSLQVVLLPTLMISLRGVRSRWELPAWQLAPFFPLLRMAAEHLCPFSLLTGLTFPMLCRLAATSERASGRAIGLVYAVESLGSLIGGAVVTFIFVVYCEPLTGAWILGVLTAINLVWFSLGVGGRTGRVSAAVSVALAVGFLIAATNPLRSTIERWSAGLRHKSYGAGFEWLAERSTPYQHLALARRGEQYNLLSNGQFISSFPDPYAISQCVHLMMSQCEKPRRILLIGGGENGTLRSLLLYPDLRIDYVEIDPQVLEIVRPHLEEADRIALQREPVHIFHEDARHFVRWSLAHLKAFSPPHYYDAILCTTPDPSTAALNRFYTQDFFEQASRLLSPSGVFVTSISSGVNYFDRELLDYVGSVYAALRKTFRNVLATPGTRAVLFATNKDDLLTSDVQRLIARFDRRGINDPSFSPLYFHTAYEANQLQLVNQTFRRTLGTIRPNTDTDPVTYLYHLRLWNRFSGGRSQRFFALIERYNWRAVAAGCGMLCVLLVVFGGWGIPSDRRAYRLAVAVLVLTGMSGMVSSVVLLLLFQNFHGSLYRHVGLLVALFMAGLTGGSFFANRVGRDEKGRLLGAIGICSLLSSGFFLALAIVGKGLGGLAEVLFSHVVFFYLAMVAAGGLTGAQFPLVGRLAIVCGRDLGRVGGTLECLDHIGACLGAFLTGMVLIPVSGIAATLGIFGWLELLAGVVLFGTLGSSAGRQ
jgi:spermidine synthase